MVLSCLGLSRKEYWMGAPYIIIEGIDGSGKSTVMEYVRQEIEDLGYKTLLAQEPGDTYLWKTWLKTLKNKEDPMVVHHQGLAARLSYWFSGPGSEAIEDGSIVISDRSYISGLIYQGHYDRFMPMYRNILPYHNAFLLRLRPKTAFDRIQERGEDDLDVTLEQLIDLEEQYENLFALHHPDFQIINVDGEKPELIARDLVSTWSKL